MRKQIDIPGNLYEIDKCGKIYSKPRKIDTTVGNNKERKHLYGGNILKPYLSKIGYYKEWHKDGTIARFRQEAKKKRNDSTN